MTVLVALIILILIKPGNSQYDNNVNIPIRSYCCRNAPVNLSDFINNRNSTLTQIRRQLSINGVYYARAQSLSDGDSVFGAGQCRKYLSAAQCLACFDAGASQLIRYTTGNGAYTFLDNCFVRYDNYADFYNNPSVFEQWAITPLCGNQPASRPLTNFRKVVDGLLSDIRVATPKTSDFYVASTRQIPADNATVYAIAQCAENTTQSICRSCINTAYTNLYSCIPNTEGRHMDMGCFARYSVTPFFNDNQTTDMADFLTRGHSIKVGMIAGVGGVGVFLVILVLWILYQPRKKFKKTDGDAKEMKGAINYNYKDLQLATNNFSKENMVGKGGFGEVFKAIHDGNNFMAVKKLIAGNARAKLEFENEVKLISNIRHRNLLRLLGWSSEGSDLLLVLEYMPNGSLDKFLWGAKRGSLSWKLRFDIIYGIARGLAHLHNESHVKIIHRDIKSSNILLDDKLKPKIADFGLARFQSDDESHVRTTFAGTMGYTSPEYVIHGHLSEKVDTFSFGIVTLEIVSGQRCTDMNSDRPFKDCLLEQAWKLYETKLHMKFIDETLDTNEYEEEHVKLIIEIALLCTQSPVYRRPTMSDVVSMLSNCKSLGKRQLSRPTFIDYHKRINIGSFKNEIGVGNIPKKTKKFVANKQLESDKTDDKVDEMEKGINVADI